MRPIKIKQMSAQSSSIFLDFMNLGGDPIFSIWKNHTIFSTSIFDQFLHLERTIWENTKIFTTTIFLENTVLSTYFLRKYRVLHTFRF